MKTLLPLSIALALPMLGGGCLAVAVGAGAAGTVAYVRGELQAHLGHNHERTFLASSRAVDQLKFAKISERSDALAGIVEARTVEDRKITIRTSKIGDDLTKVTIRVGIFGNEAISQSILDRIKTNL